MRRLPTGMYLPGDSYMHRMDSRVKLLCLFIIIAAILCAKSILGYGIMIAFLAVIVILSGLSIRTVLNSVDKMYWFFLVILVMNTCFFSPEGACFSFWVFTPSQAGLMQGIDVVFCVFMALVTTNVLTSTTSPMDVTHALEGLMSPLKFIGIPTEEIAMILSIAIQFIPTLSEETETIRKAQMARGARFDSPRLTEKAEAVIPLVVPVFLAAFKRADELSLAMEARGYRTASDRTKKQFKPACLTDWMALTVVVGICILQIIIR